MSDFIIQELLPGSSLGLYFLKAPFVDSTSVERYKNIQMFLPRGDWLMQINIKPQYIDGMAGRILDLFLNKIYKRGR